MSRPKTIPAALALAALVAAFAVPSATQAATTKCGGSFHVLHNDRIGELNLPKGSYRITVLDNEEVSCKRASQLFASFLQDFDGNLPDGWRLKVSTATFTQRGGDGFTVKRITGGSAGGHGTSPSANATRCPTFEVLHDDVIGRAKFPQGTYQMTALGGLSCSKASSLFAAFLQDTDGNLPGNWRLDNESGTFTRGSKRKGFHVNLWR